MPKTLCKLERAYASQRIWALEALALASCCDAPRYEGEGAPRVEERLSWTPSPLLSVACGRDPAPCRGRLRSS
jgi:hypothetical protein